MRSAWAGPSSSTPVPQHALIIFVEVDWAELGTSFPIRAELVDSDGVRVAHTEHGVIKAKHQSVHPEGTAVTIPFTATIPRSSSPQVSATSGGCPSTTRCTRTGWPALP